MLALAAKTAKVDENRGDGLVWALRRCKTKPQSRGGGGGGGESARSDGGTPRARAPKRGDNAENGSGNGNRDDGPMGVLRGTLAGGS